MKSIYKIGTGKTCIVPKAESATLVQIEINYRLTLLKQPLRSSHLDLYSVQEPAIRASFLE